MGFGWPASWALHDVGAWVHGGGGGGGGVVCCGGGGGDFMCILPVR